MAVSRAESAKLVSNPIHDPPRHHFLVSAALRLRGHPSLSYIYFVEDFATGRGALPSVAGVRRVRAAKENDHERPAPPTDSSEAADARHATAVAIADDCSEPHRGAAASGSERAGSLAVVRGEGERTSGI